MEIDQTVALVLIGRQQLQIEVLSGQLKAAIVRLREAEDKLKGAASGEDDTRDD